MKINFEKKLFMEFIAVKKNRLILFAISLFLVFLIRMQVFVINFSPSIPVGLYMRSSFDPSLERNSIVVFDAKAVENNSSLANFVKIRRKQTENFSSISVFMKKVIGVPGDLICINEYRVFLNDRFFFLFTHSDERFLNSSSVFVNWKHGCFKIPPRFYYLAGTAIRSYDSRYFGLIEEKDLWFDLIPVFVW